MSKWDDFKNHVSKATKKAAVKTKDFADVATLKLKLKGMQIKLCEEYENLGKLYYSFEVDKEENQLLINDKIEEITSIKVEISALTAEIDEAKEKSKAKKEAEKTENEETTTVYEAEPQPPQEADTVEEAEETDKDSDK